MGLFNSSAISDVTRGGQTTIHYIRMITQVVKKVVWVCVFSGIVFYMSVMYLVTSEYEKSTILEYSLAWGHGELFREPETIVAFTLPDGKVLQTTAIKVLGNNGVRQTVAGVQVKHEFWFWASVMFSVFVFGVVFLYILKTGRLHKIDEIVKGVELVDASKLAKDVRSYAAGKRGGLSRVSIANISLPRSFETAHVNIVGAPGTGKTTVINEMLEGVSKQGNRAIVYDRSGDFVKRFYREGKDIILNPFDLRSAAWDMFLECEYDFEFDALAEVLIPDSKSGDPFWAKASRIIFSSVAQKESRNTNPSIKNVLDKMLKMSLKEIIEHVKGTDAASVLTEGGEKMGISLRAVMVSYVRPLKYLSEVDGEVFSIKNWIQNDSDSWLFLTTKENVHDLLKPLITTWIHIASQEVLSLKPDFNRRLWLFVDEIPSLNRLPQIAKWAAEARKCGGCLVTGFQNYAQMLDIYGKNGADAIIGMCATMVVFRCNDSGTREWASREIGKHEISEVNEGLSYGVSEIRDGVNLGKNRKLRELVTPSDINDLDDLHGYIKFGRGLHVGRFLLKPSNNESGVDGYKPRYVRGDGKLKTINEVDNEAEFIGSWGVKKKDSRANSSEAGEKDAKVPKATTSTKSTVKQVTSSKGVEVKKSTINFNEELDF